MGYASERGGVGGGHHTTTITTNSNNKQHPKRTATTGLLWLLLVLTLWMGVMVLLQHGALIKFTSTTTSSKTRQHASLTKETFVVKTGSTPLTTPAATHPPKDITPASHKQDSTKIVGTWNSIPIVRQTLQQQKEWHSHVECLLQRQRQQQQHQGQPDDWMYQSCRFTNLCFNVNTTQYVLFPTTTNQTTKLTYDSQSVVALGGINPRWDMNKQAPLSQDEPVVDDRGSYKVQWFPQVVRLTASAKNDEYQIYWLPSSTIWIPFYSFAGHNVGHLLWDDFYAIYKVTMLFQVPLVSPTPPPPPTTTTTTPFWFLLRHVLQDTLYASCDIRRNKRMQCTQNFVKFLPLLGVDPQTFSSTKRTQLQVNNNQDTTSPVDDDSRPVLICARHGVAGLGMLTDHGRHDHGWESKDFWIPHNLGHGRTFYNFRQYMIDHWTSTNKIKGNRRDSVIQKKDATMNDKTITTVITFSLLSSRDLDRRLDFDRQIDTLKKTLSPDDHVQVQALKFWNLTVDEQIQVMLDTDIFVSSCGGSSMISTFLKRDASLILFYNSTGGLDFEHLASNGRPARLDWDLLNNAGHLRLHWLPLTGMDTEWGLELFARLIRHEVKARTLR